ncbi:MAG: fluoride efflux transporter CrcB [Solirubrobacteraceae bacterium]|nr:fluoride efflux transporter CrcB [Solirubrobacteraceae bacterium]
MRADRRVLAAIFAGGFCGTVVRALVGEALPYQTGEWPWATLVVNVAGALVLGYVITRVEAGREPFRHAGRLLGTGFCAALTTFSTLQLELLEMLDDDRYALAAAYALVSIAAGLLAVVLTTRLAEDVR